MKQLFYFMVCMGFFIASHAQPTTITFSENPTTHIVPKAWRGHNHGANSNLDWIENVSFEMKFPMLKPGIFRWPGGNDANNFDWETHLNTTNGTEFNLAEAAAFIKQYDVEMQIVVNYGNGFADDAAYLVWLCNDPSASSERQALLGDPDPLNVKYWEIGNEITTQWGFAFSWLGQWDEIKFRTGDPIKNFTQYEADSLYFYGGDFWREGWVKEGGGSTKKTAILGDLKFINTNLDSFVLDIDYPKLDINDPTAVRVFHTSDVDFGWADTIATQQALYDSLAQLYNLLDTSHFYWDATTVSIIPPGGLNPNDVLLVEYNSTQHDGAFAYQAAMKAADQSIEIGYCTKVRPHLEDSPVFQTAFKNNPADFMIVHPYYSNLTSSAVNSGRFSEVAYVPVYKKQNEYIPDQIKWDDRETDWMLPNDVGVSYTEWNVGLCDECPNNHPFDGIAGAVYIASFWGNLFETAIDDSIDIRMINHFALVASGNNFIHLFHANTSNFWAGNEGIATRMLMETIGEQIYHPTVSNMPQIQLDDGNTINLMADALQIWGGYNPDSSCHTLFIINRDDETDRDITINFPPAWNVTEAHIEELFGTMIDNNMTNNVRTDVVTNDQLVLTLPKFSLTTLKVADNPVLAVEMLDFYGNVVKGKVHLHWQTSLENQLSHFEIMHSSDGVHFEKIGNVVAGGNNYKFIDPVPNTGQNFYQLKKVLQDGRFDFSNTISVDVQVALFQIEKFIVQEESLLLTIHSAVPQNLSISVSNAIGQVIIVDNYFLGTGGTEISLSIPETGSGVYFLKMGEAVIKFFKS